MRFDVLTIFPGMFAPVLGASVIGRAIKNGIIGVNVVDIREFSTDKHKKTDDYPYGGGSGMVMTPQPLYDAWKSVVSNGYAGAEGTPGTGKPSEPGLHASPPAAAAAPEHASARTIYLSPQGVPLTQKKALELSREQRLILICGHYEGVDERVLELTAAEEISIGDYVLTGGEIPAMALIDCVSRLVPGVLSSEEAYKGESHYDVFLEYPQYTRPEIFMGLETPRTLLEGNHRDIAKWRRAAAVERTRRKRPDILAAYPRRIPLSGADNVRDLGGYPAKDGAVTRWRTFLRSDMIDGLSVRDKAVLLDMGLATVIDLRSRVESETRPDAITRADGVDCHNIPLISDAAIERSIQNKPFKELYVLFAERGKKKIGKVFKKLSESCGACLFHCYAGKDRTGIIAALLLMVAGVADADVTADYEVSGTYHGHRYSRLDAASYDAIKDQISSNPDTIVYFMNYLKNKYGGAKEYLLSAGVTEGEIGAILGRFLSPRI